MRQRFQCKHNYIFDTSVAGLAIPLPGGGGGGLTYPCPTQESISRGRDAHTHTLRKTFNAAKLLSSKKLQAHFASLQGFLGRHDGSQQPLGSCVSYLLPTPFRNPWRAGGPEPDPAYAAANWNMCG